LGFLVIALCLLMIMMVFAPEMVQAEQVSTVTIEVFDRESGDPVPNGFRFIINEDIAHDEASTTNPRTYTPLVATGEWNMGEPFPTVSLPAGKYLVSVLGGPFPATPDTDPPGYKLNGKHVTVDGASPATVRVDLVPNPLPLSTLRVFVFHDNTPLDTKYAFPLESGISDFSVVVGDPTGEVSVDFFANPLCTAYDGVGDSTPLGDPIPGTGGKCLTGADGIVVIPNLPPLKYTVEAVPPDGSSWVQTTTNGGLGFDTWLEEGASGLSTLSGRILPSIVIGFTTECTFGDVSDGCTANDTIPADAGAVTGRLREVAIGSNAPGDVTLGQPVARPFVGLSNQAGNGQNVYVGRGNSDGTFTIPNVPPGLYGMSLWDFGLDYTMQFLNLEVLPGQTVDLGDIALARHFGTIQGYVFNDTGIALDGTEIPGGAENGLRDCYDAGGGIDPNNLDSCEEGLLGVDLNVRFKDGSIADSTFTDANGYYEFPEYPEWRHFLVWEVGFGRMAQIGTAAYETDLFGQPISNTYPISPTNQATGLASLLQAQMTWVGTTTWIDSGKRAYSPGENGGIAGIVYYATTRNEFDPRLAAAEEYEPGVPGVTVNLYEAVLDENGEPIVEADGSLQKGALVDSVQTDNWDDGNHPTNCEYDHLYPGSGEVRVDPQCLEFSRTWNQVADGVFDGGYAFENLAAGEYIVEVVPPAGYRQIREEDQNTDQGDQLEPDPTVVPPPCAGALHLVDDPRNPADGTETPLCDNKLVSLVDGFNAPADFYLMTDNAVPAPGMLRGQLVDPLAIEQNPESPNHLQPRGIYNTPIGILDYQNNEIARAYTDENGFWEVLLPSSYTAHCPTPGGICPGIYRIIANYPGDIQNPDAEWNMSYGMLQESIDIWPGKTSFSYMALNPTLHLTQDSSGSFTPPVHCSIPTDTPDLQSVSQPYGSSGDSFSITGSGFGSVQGTGSVTLDGLPLTVNSWSESAIELSIPSGHATGTSQLLLTADNGNSSPTGLTFHLLGDGADGGDPYNPPLIHVDAAAAPGGDGSVTAPYKTIQEALDASEAGSGGELIIVQEGIYFENLILSSNVKLQGHGPRTVIDGRFFNLGGLGSAGFGAKISSIAYDGPALVPSDQVITILAKDGEFAADYTTQIDGFTISGGNVLRGNLPPSENLLQQGGGIYAHAYARHLEISNNLIQGNSGLQGGAIMMGQPFTENPSAANALDNENDSLYIHHNRVLNNGAISLSGAIALYNGSNDYQITQNIICGNYTPRNGAGIAHVGFSPNGHIHDNEILFNYGGNEGGGMILSGETQNSLSILSPGSGDLLVENNRIQGNVCSDDGGAFRVVDTINAKVQIQNNMIVNNVATDSGGAISMQDALDVRIVNNTIAKNISTSTSIDADRTTCEVVGLGTCPHSAGILTGLHSQAVIENLGLSADGFSDPLLLNNIFWQNTAFFLDGSGGVRSEQIDLEVFTPPAPAFLTPNYSLLTVPHGSGTGNIVGSNAHLVDEIDIQFVTVPSISNPAFITIILLFSPDDPLGDYHLTALSPAIDAGSTTDDVPVSDFDGEVRPQGKGVDMGADETGLLRRYEIYFPLVPNQ